MENKDIKDLQQVREALEYALDVSPNFHIQQKAQIALAALDRVLERVGWMKDRKAQWWLAELDMHGNAKLIDGQHKNVKGVEKAMYILNGIGLSKGRRFACAYVLLSPIEGKPHGANKAAINAAKTILNTHPTEGG